MICLEEVFLVMCAFSEKKVHSLSVAPKPLAFWHKELEGLLLRVPEHIPGFFIKKSSDIARSGFFLS